jgi:hypothetical protein
MITPQSGPDSEGSDILCSNAPSGNHAGQITATFVQAEWVGARLLSHSRLGLAPTISQGEEGLHGLLVLAQSQTRRGLICESTGAATEHNSRLLGLLQC